MQSTGTAALTELLECAICLDTYTRPKVLPCQHTYCYSCLLALGNKQYTIKCPQCRVVHDIPKDGMAGLKDNLVINNLLSLSIHEEGPKCSDCKEAPVVSVCAHCAGQVCTPCLVQHSELSTELRTTLNEIKENLLSEENRHRLTEKKSRLQESMAVLKNEVGRMKEVFDDAIQNLVKRRNQMENFIEVVLRIYKDLLHASGGSLANTSYLSTLSEKLVECRTTKSLRRLKENVSDLKTTSRLIQTRDDHFRFIGEARTLSTETFGEIEFGQAIVDIKAQYEVAGSESKTPRDDSESRSGDNETTRRCVATKIMKDVETMTDSTDINSEHVIPSTPSTGAPSDSCTPSAEITHYIIPYATPFRGAAENTNPSFCRLARAESMPVLAREPTQPRYYQNQLPTGLDYQNKGTGWITIIGRGKYVQDVSLRLKSPYGCAYHVARDEIYVADHDDDRIMVYDSTGRNGRVFYSGLIQPCDVAISEDGEYILIAGRNALYKVTVGGELVTKIESFVEKDLEDCISVVCEDNHVALLDHHHNCVIVYTDSDKYVSHFGARYLKEPMSIAVDGNGDFYVADFISSCVHVFERNGQFLETFGQLNNNDDIGGITVDGDGFVSVSRRQSGRIDVYEPHRERRLLTSFGKPGKRPGQLQNPISLCLMPDGRMIVVDASNDRLQIF